MAGGSDKGHEKTNVVQKRMSWPSTVIATNDINNSHDPNVKNPCLRVTRPALLLQASEDHRQEGRHARLVEAVPCQSSNGSVGNQTWVDERSAFSPASFQGVWVNRNHLHLQEFLGRAGVEKIRKYHRTCVLYDLY